MAAWDKCFYLKKRKKITDILRNRYGKWIDGIKI